MHHGRDEGLSLSPSFWSADSVVSALLRREVGELFRLVTTRGTGVSQTRLGAAVGLSQGQVSDIAKGSRQVVRLDVLERIADGLAMPDECRMFLGLAPNRRAPAPPTAQPDSAARADEAVGTSVARVDKLADADARGTIATRGSAFTPGLGTRSTRDWLLSRAMNPSKASNTPTEVPDARRILDMFATFQDLDTRHGGATARRAIVDYVRTSVSPTFRATSDPAQLKSLAGATAELVYLAGLTAFDSGECGLAQRYFVNALKLAEHAEDDGFAANVFAAMAHLWNTHGLALEASKLAQAGLLAAKAVGNWQVAMRLHISHARAYAISGENAPAVAAMSAAETALEKARPVGVKWSRYLDESYLFGEMSYTFLDLGDLSAADRYASKSVEENSGRDRRLLLSQTTRAISQLRKGGDVDFEAIGHLLTTARGIRSSRALRAVRDLASELEKVDTDRGRLYRQQAAQLLAAPGHVVRCCPIVPMP